MESRISFIFSCLGADVDWMDVNKDGLSAIHIAALKGETNIVQKLINAGCDVNAQDM